MPTNVRDPRTVITPDAFEISPDLLGTPLAPPWRRFWALMIDLLVIAIATQMLEGVAMFVFGVVAVILIFASFRTRFGSGQAVSIMLRAATGCLGVTILAVIGLVFLINTLSAPDGGAGSFPQPPDVESVEGDLSEGLRIAAAEVSGGPRLREAETAEEAEEVALSLLGDLEKSEMTDEERLDFLDHLTPEDAAWEGEADEIYARALAAWRETVPEEAGETLAGTPDADEEPPDRGDDGEAGGAEQASGADDEQAAEIAALSDAEVVRRYAALLEGDTARAGAPGARALRRRVALLVAEDTVAALGSRLGAVRDSVQSERRRRQRAEVELEDRGNAFIDLLRDVWDQLGSAIGLWSLYFTVLLTVWKGQTVGKRLLGLRVLRLDGGTINWWSAFERGGGYIAGVATGLLGFAQVFWDPNRQCIHDKIVGTVVVDARVARVAGAWQEAWTGSDEEST